MQESQSKPIPVQKIFAISDIHVDYKSNEDFITNLNQETYKQSALVLAGDVSHDLLLLEKTLKNLLEKFACVFFVPGNHDLWIEQGGQFRDSVQKFFAVLSLCKRLGVHTSSIKLQVEKEYVWLVPLFSWYVKPEEDMSESLYHPPLSGIENVDQYEALWSDNYRCRWPTMIDTVASYFHTLNLNQLSASYDAPVITVSHFVPRIEMIVQLEEDRMQVNKERIRLGLTPDMPLLQTSAVEAFNFTRYAGCKAIDNQLRSIHSVLHVYGHQHRNRDRTIDGVQYVAHCLGTPREQQSGLTWGIIDWNGPKQIWPRC